MNRAQREGAEAAEVVFNAAGWATRTEHGGKHFVVVASAPDGSEHRLPIAGSPGHGSHGAVMLARWTARKIIRRSEERKIA